jgi:hypothetical protein
MSNEMNSDPWIYHMRKGEFEAAWEISDKILQSHLGQPCWHLPRHYQYVWDGSPLEGKRVLIRCYHGLGDTINFVRYAPLVKSIAKEVMVWAQPELLPLLKTMEGIEKLLPLHDGTPETDYEADIELMELLHYFRTTLQTIPANVPYFNIKPIPVENRHNINIGLVWKAGDWDIKRSVPFHLIKPLAEIPGITLHILQKGTGLLERENNFGILSGSDDILQLAGIIKGLDLIISVDTMITHLTGALAVPVWNLIHSDADWRWLEERDDSPWYPTMKLFRQETPGDWEPVIKKVIDQLKLLKT